MILDEAGRSLGPGSRCKTAGANPAAAGGSHRRIPLGFSRGSASILASEDKDRNDKRHTGVDHPLIDDGGGRHPHSIRPPA